MRTILKLIRTELRLVLREPLVLVFVFAFPVVTVLVIAGCFGADDAHSFANTDPSRWYVASYLAVAIAAIGLVMVPAHLAGRRARCLRPGLAARRPPVRGGSGIAGVEGCAGCDNSRPGASCRTIALMQ